MDRSYRVKMEERLNNNVLTVEYVINCIAKFENKINGLAYKEKQYRNYKTGYIWEQSMYDELKLKLDDMIEYRKPFVDCLIRDCHMPLDDIKDAVTKVKEKNIPTKKVCDRIREIICSGFYEFE